jgi:hypothetical protein
VARIEAEVAANIGPFRRALGEALEGAREWGRKVGEVGTDFTKEVGGNKLSNMIGLAGAGVAVAAFGAGLVETAKTGLEAFGHMETRVLTLKANLKDPAVAEAVNSWLESLPAAAGNIDDLTNGMRSLLESGLSLDQAKKTLLDLSGVAIKTGDSVGELAEAFRRAKAGGLDAGEGATRLLKQLPGLSMAIQPMIDKAASDFAKHAPRSMNEMGQMTMSAEDQATYTKMKGESAADFVKSGKLDTSKLEELLSSMAPKDLLAEKANTLEGREAQLGKVFEQLEVSIGAALAPGIEKLITGLADKLPELTAKFDSAALVISENVLPALTAFAKFVGDAVQTPGKWGAGEVDYFVGKANEGKMDRSTQQLDTKAYGADMVSYGRDLVRLTLDQGLGMKLPDLNAMEGIHPTNPTGSTDVAPMVDKQAETNELLKQQNEALAQVLNFG